MFLFTLGVGLPPDTREKDGAVGFKRLEVLLFLLIRGVRLGLVGCEASFPAAGRLGFCGFLESGTLGWEASDGREEAGRNPVGVMDCGACRSPQGSHIHPPYSPSERERQLQDEYISLP